jgi:hypothetical protein
MPIPVPVSVARVLCHWAEKLRRGRTEVQPKSSGDLDGCSTFGRQWCSPNGYELTVDLRNMTKTGRNVTLTRRAVTATRA